MTGSEDGLVVVPEKISKMSPETWRSQPPPQQRDTIKEMIHKKVKDGTLSEVTNCARKGQSKVTTKKILGWGSPGRKDETLMDASSGNLKGFTRGPTIQNLQNLDDDVTWEDLLHSITMEQAEIVMQGLEVYMKERTWESAITPDQYVRISPLDRREMCNECFYSCCLGYELQAKHEPDFETLIELRKDLFN
jgi:hypothetical protein